MKLPIMLIVVSTLLMFAVFAALLLDNLFFASGGILAMSCVFLAACVVYVRNK